MTEQQNALLIFGEELAEVAVELLNLQNTVSKAIRFGVNEQRDLPTSNIERINQEFDDLLGSLCNLQDKGVNIKPSYNGALNKVAKIRKYTEYSKLLGQVGEIVK